MSAKFPCVPKRPIVPGIIDLPRFNYEDLEEIVAGGQGSFGVYCENQIWAVGSPCFKESKLNDLDYEQLVGISYGIPASRWMTSAKFACFNGCPPSGGQFPYDSVHELSKVTSLSEYFEAFQHYDKDKSGFITAKDLGNLMKSLGENPTENELQRIINTVDADGNGKMDFQEFVQLMSKKNQHEMNLKEVKEAFRIFDQDDRGYVLTSELRQAFERLEDEIPEAELEEILEDSYHGKSRKLFFEEFKKMTRVQNYHDSVTSSSHNCIN